MSKPASVVILCALAVTASTVSLGAGIACPKGTSPNGEQTPDVNEAWCEVQWHGATVMHGPYRSWWSNGKLGTYGQYVYGKAEGKWRGWYKTGELQGEEWFENGKSVKVIYYDKKGHVVSEPET